MKLLFFPFFAGMNIGDSKNYFNRQCSSLYDKEETEEIFSRIAEHLTSKTKLALTLEKDIDIDEKRFKEIIAELVTKKPIQYVLGYEWFYNLTLNVNDHVLIPRPETEELVRWILDTLKIDKSKHFFFLDIGTGSGCIPIVIKNEMPESIVTAIDISPSALKVAITNANLYKLDIEFIEGDILDSHFSIQQSFDIIASNPPYITSTEKNEMLERVLSFEPNEALFVTNGDPLQFYKAILLFSKNHLAPNGRIFLEVNSEYGKQTEILFLEGGYETELRKDMYGNIRMLMAKKRAY